MEKIFPVLLDRVSDSSDDVSPHILFGESSLYSLVHEFIMCPIALLAWWLRQVFTINFSVITVGILVRNFA